MMQIIDASFVPLVWEDAIDLLAAAIDLGGEYTHESVYKALCEGKMFL